MPRRKGESLDDYISRIAASTLARIRLQPDYYDPEGNVLVQPVVIFGKDTNDDIRPARMDTEGKLDVVGFVPTQQAQAYLTQANPISGDKYEVLPVTENVRIIHMAAQSTWTVQPSPLELFMRVDGEPFRFYRNNPANNTWYYPLFQGFTTHEAGILTTTAPYNDRAFLIEGREIDIALELTGGTASNMRCRVTYATW